MPDEDNNAPVSREQRLRKLADRMIDAGFQEGITRGIGIAIIHTFLHKFEEMGLTDYARTLRLSREQVERLLEASWDFQTADDMTAWLDTNA